MWIISKIEIEIAKISGKKLQGNFHFALFPIKQFAWFSGNSPRILKTNKVGFMEAKMFIAVRFDENWNENTFKNRSVEIIVFLLIKQTNR